MIFWAFTCRGLVLLGLLGFTWSGCFPMGNQTAKRRVNAYMQRAENEKDASDFNGAVEAYEKALQIDPDLARAHLELGLLYDNNLDDPVSAVYHFEHYRRLSPEAEEKKPFIKSRIVRCKQELAKGVSLAPVAQDIQEHLQSVKQENVALKKERDKLRKRVEALTTKLKRSQLQINQLKSRLELPSDAGVKISESGSGGGGGIKFGHHTVKRNETMYQIKERYGITLEQLKAANPDVNPRRMKEGTRLKIPNP